MFLNIFYVTRCSAILVVHLQQTAYLRVLQKRREHACGLIFRGGYCTVVGEIW
jgi:hypothetical protein